MTNDNNTPNIPLACIILAAGRGSRMKSTLPKTLHKVAGRSMIDWLLDSVENLSPQHIVTVIGEDMNDLSDQVELRGHRCTIQNNPKGTGHAVEVGLSALDDFNGNILILLGDMPLITPETMVRLVNTKQDGLSVLGVVLDPPPPFGRLVLDDKGVLERIVEDKDAEDWEKALTLCNTGAFCVDAEQLRSWIKTLYNNNAQNEFYFTDIPAIAKNDGINTYVAITENPIETLGVNTRADLANLEYYVQGALRQQALDDGATLIDPDSVFLSWDTKIGKDVIIQPHVFIGEGVEIADNVTVKAFSHLEHTVIGDSTSIGPFARLRGDNTIGENCDIGNFVEVKKSEIANGVKAKHLAYLGDAVVGANANIGCGAITVNYDGQNKHKTHIGENVMVGSNVNLVAPVTLHDGSYIAAGSTITKDVAADDLAVSRADTRIMAGWAAKRRKAS